MGIANLGGQLADKGCIGVLATAVDDPADLCGGPFNDLRSSNIGVWREVSRDEKPVTHKAQPAVPGQGIARSGNAGAGRVRKK
jgi:hypothetical protein